MGRTWGSWGLSLERIRNDTGNEVWGKGTVSRVCRCTDPRLNTTVHVYASCYPLSQNEIKY